VTTAVRRSEQGICPWYAELVTALTNATDKKTAARSADITNPGYGTAKITQNQNPTNNKMMQHHSHQHHNHPNHRNRQHHNHRNRQHYNHPQKTSARAQPPTTSLKR
jgi:hypothetical protein